MRWFGRKVARGDARPAMGRGLSVREAIGRWPTGYEAQVRDAYLDNPVAQRAVRIVCESVEAAPFAEAEPGLEAAVRPVLGTVAAHLLLNGNAFVQPVEEEGRPVLYPLRPERVSVELDGQGWPAAYLYRAGGTASRLMPGEVVHIARFHPLDDHLGLGCLGAAAGAVAIHNAATRWSKSLLDNAARPSGALVYAPEAGAALSADQYQRLKEELEASFQGAANAGRPMLLDGGLKWQAMSLTPADMDFGRLREAAARDIALAFGVPPMLLGLPGDATYANYREASRALWRSTVIPLADAVLRRLAEAVRPWFPEATLSVDPDLVPALAEDRRALWQSLTAADFLTREEKRQMLGFAS